MNYPTLEELGALVRSTHDFLLAPPQTEAFRLKRPNDFVTAADLGVQQRVQAALSRAYPDIPFMAEESDDHTVNAARATFVLDPVDGTSNYVYSFRHSAVSLALVEGGKSLLGVVYDPYQDELFAAERGKGATVNGVPIHSSAAASLSEVLGTFGPSPYRRERADEAFRVAKRLYLSCVDIRRTGSCALDLCYTAAGRSGVYTERGLGLWDYAAGGLILEEAGGVLTDWNGNVPDYLHGCDLAAGGNPALHGALLTILREEADGGNR